MNRSYVIYENRDTREKLEVKAPLQSLVNLTDLMKETGIPDYIDPSNFQMKKATVALWAFGHPDRLIPGGNGEPLKVALFGGAAFKFCCPSANKGPFCRKIGDIDFVTLKENGKRVVELLCSLSEKCGSMFFHGVPEVDKRFNTLRTAMRYRVRTIKDTDGNGVPIPGLMDIFCDKLTFCHTVDVRAELNEIDRHHFTIGLENLIISKAQFIKSVAKSEASNIDQSRILGEYDKTHVLVGMETKDMQDVLAALLDHDLGEGPDKINVDVIGSKLRQDWRIWKTVTMTLKNMHQKLETITSSFGADKDDREVISGKLAKIVEQLEGKYVAKKSVFDFSKQWWEDVEDQVLSSRHVHERRV